MKKLLLATAISAVLSTPALATNGIAPVGVGQSAKGSGGATVAYPQDTLVAGTNPAGMVHLGDRIDAGIEIFSPNRRFTISGTGAPPPNGADGTFSGNNPDWFLIPEFGYNKMISDRTSVGVAVFGNGGMNANYDFHPLVAGFTGGATAKSKIDLAQMFIMPTWSHKYNDRHSFGVSAIFAIQSFELINGAFFAPPPSPGHEITYGAGLRLGWMGKLTDRITLGASYQTPISMSDMDDYSNSIEGGSIDIPQNFTFGAAFKANDKLDILADVYWIDYAGSDPTGIPTADPTNPNSFPGGFGWDDIWVLKLGAVYKYSDDLTLRAGINHGESPLPSGSFLDGFANTVVPATTQTHLTAGFTKKLKDNFSLTGSFIYALKEDFTTPGFAPLNPSDPSTAMPPITTTMDQWALGISGNWTF